MTPLTCTEADALIDLYAADACDAAETAAVSAHLATCPSCEAAVERSRELIAGLDWRARETPARERLRDAIEAEARPRFRPRAAPVTWSRRLGALAALLLVVLGLTILLAPRTEGLEEPLFASVESRWEADKAIGELAFPKPVHGGHDVQVARGHLPGRDLAIDVRNDGDRAVRLSLKGELSIAARGPGRLRGPVTAVPDEVTVKPGATERITLRGVTVTKPGLYSLGLWAEARLPATDAEPEKNRRQRLAVDAFLP